MVAMIAPNPMTRDRLLHAAAVAMRLGVEPVAGMITRILLERHVHRLCVQFECLPERRFPTLEQCMGRLYNKRHMSKPTHREMKGALKVCNRCAHGEPVAWHEVKAAVSSIEGFLMTHPLPAAG